MFYGSIFYLTKKKLAELIDFWFRVRTGRCGSWVRKSKSWRESEGYKVISSKMLLRTHLDSIVNINFVKFLPAGLLEIPKITGLRPQRAEKKSPLRFANMEVLM